MMKSLLKVLFLFVTFFISNADAQDVVWNDLTGQGEQMPFNINNFAIDPSGKIYASASNGLFFLDDKGNVWNKLDSVKITVASIVINSRGGIFISGSYGSTATVVLYSDDSGNNWKDLTSNLPAQSSASKYSLAIDSKDVIYCGTQKGLYFSTDNGTTWQKNTKCQLEFIRALGINNDIIYAFGGYQYFFYMSVSSDMGNTWNLSFSIQDPGFTSTDFCFIKPQNKAILSFTYAGYFPHSNVMYISSGSYYSADMGKTWSSYNSYKGNFTSVIAVDSVTNLASIADNGIIRTNNHGDTWSRSDSGLTNQSVFALIKDKAGRIFAGTKSSIYISEDHGYSWSTTSSLPKSLYYCLGRSSEGYIYTANNAGVYRSSDNGAKWQQVNKGLLEIFPSINFFNDEKNMFIYYKDPTDNRTKYLFKLNAGTDQWVRCNGILSAMGMAKNSKGDLFSYYSYSYYTVDANYYFSTDRGDNWNKGTDISITTSDILSLALDSKDNLYLSLYGEIRKRSYLENSWTTFKTPVTTFRVLGSTKTNNLIALGLSDRSSTGETTYYNFYVSGNEGKDWQPVTHNEFIYSTDAQPRLFIDNWDNLLISYKGTLKISNDLGKNWKDISGSLKNSIIQDINIDNMGFAYVAADNGLFKSSSKVISQSTDGVSNERSSACSFTLMQNYPNPFNPSTMITYSIPESQNVKLTVYDMLGKEVATLVNGYQQSGIHTVQFNAYDLPSGIYIYTIQAGQLRDSKKLVVLK